MTLRKRIATARLSISYTKAALLIVASTLLGCERAPPDAAPVKPDDAMSNIRSAITEKARAAAGGAHCTDIAMPDNMFLAIEVTGGAPEEIAVAFDQLPCPRAFSGTPGGVMQFWKLDGGDARLILEQQMHRFSAAEGGLVTLQHGGECGGPGTDYCRVSYRWDGQAQRLVRTEAALTSTLGQIPAMDYDYRLTRLSR